MKEVKMILIGLAALVVVGGTGAAIYLSQRSQESRSSAAPKINDWTAAKSIRLKCNRGHWSWREKKLKKGKCVSKGEWKGLAEKFCQKAGGVKYFYGINSKECGQTWSPIVPPSKREPTLKPRPTNLPITPPAATPTAGNQPVQTGYYEAQVTCKTGRWSQKGKGGNLVKLGRCLSVAEWHDLANRFCPEVETPPNYSQLLMVSTASCGL